MPFLDQDIFINYNYYVIITGELVLKFEMSLKVKAQKLIPIKHRRFSCIITESCKPFKRQVFLISTICSNQIAHSSVIYRTFFIIIIVLYLSFQVQVAKKTNISSVNQRTEKEQINHQNNYYIND